MTDAERAVYFAGALPFFSSLSLPEQTLLCEHTRSLSFECGDLVHSGDGGCTGAILLRRGRIRAYMLSEEGREVTIYRLAAGDFCPLAAPCLIGTQGLAVTLEAECRTELELLEPGAFAELCRKNTTVENFMLRAVMLRFTEVMSAFRGILFGSLDRRLASFLVGEIDRHGGDTVYLTQEEIARYTGSAREAVSRRLKIFAAEGWIAVLRGGVKLLDTDALRALFS